MSILLHQSRSGEGQGEAGGAGNSWLCVAQSLCSVWSRQQDRRLWSCTGEAEAEIRGGEVSGDEFRGVATNVDN